MRYRGLHSSSGERGSVLLEHAILIAIIVPALMVALWPHPENRLYQALRNVHRRAVIIVGTPGL